MGSCTRLEKNVADAEHPLVYVLNDGGAIGRPALTRAAGTSLFSQLSLSAVVLQKLKILKRKNI